MVPHPVPKHYGLHQMARNIGIHMWMENQLHHTQGEHQRIKAKQDRHLSCPFSDSKSYCSKVSSNEQRHNFQPTNHQEVPQLDHASLGGET